MDAYSPHNWIISTSIPSDLSSAKMFVVSDTLDHRLDFLGNIRVVVEGYKIQESSSMKPVYQDIELAEEVDYILSVTDNDSLSEGKPADSFTVSLMQSGMSKAANGRNLRIYFDARINSNAQVGEAIPNQAVLEYTNSVGVSLKDESDIPEVKTGAIRMLKVDAEDHNMTLAGAQFQVYRPANELEIADESISKVMLENLSDPMIQVEFFDNPDLSGEKVVTAVTGNDGVVYVYGLAYGTYYLKETAAPAGYNLLGAPVELTIDEQSHMDESTVIVENARGVILPETGGAGTYVFEIFGILLTVFSGVLLVLKKRQSC